MCTSYALETLIALDTLISLCPCASCATLRSLIALCTCYTLEALIPLNALVSLIPPFTLVSLIALVALRPLSTYIIPAIIHLVANMQYRH